MSTISKTENRVLMLQAREALQGKWGLAIGTTVLFSLIVFFVQITAIILYFKVVGIDNASSSIPLFINLFSLVVSAPIVGPMVLGLAAFGLSLSRKQEAELSQIFSGFNKFSVGMVAFILKAIFVFLWSLLFTIPGIIASLSYSQTSFIIAENDSITALEAIKKSKEMMKGNKWKYFCLSLRFFGWGLLCILTLGIGFLWLHPYSYVSLAQFYDDLKKDDEESAVPQIETESSYVI